MKKYDIDKPFNTFPLVGNTRHVCIIGCPCVYTLHNVETGRFAMRFTESLYSELPAQLEALKTTGRTVEGRRLLPRNKKDAGLIEFSYWECKRALSRAETLDTLHGMKRDLMEQARKKKH
ncbi:hypothetical protein M2F94_03725 [Vibrio vulnificus]|nr:hypothetical protein [Vibrio vulnificus]